MNSKYTLLLFITLFAVNTGLAMERSDPKDTLDATIQSLQEKSNVPINELCNLQQQLTLTNFNSEDLKVEVWALTRDIDLSDIYKKWKKNSNQNSNTTNSALVPITNFIKSFDYNLRFRVYDTIIECDEIKIHANGNIEPMLNSFKQRIDEQSDKLKHFFTQVLRVYKKTDDIENTQSNTNDVLSDPVWSEHEHTANWLVTKLTRNEGRAVYRCFTRKDLSEGCKWLLWAHNKNKHTSVRDAIKETLFPELEKAEKELQTAEETIKTLQHKNEELQKTKIAEPPKALRWYQKPRGMFAIVGLTAVTGLVAGNYVPNIGSAFSGIMSSVSNSISSWWHQ